MVYTQRHTVALAACAIACAGTAGAAPQAIAAHA